MQTLELVTFRIVHSDAAGFLKANGELNDWLKRQPGFIARHLASKDDGSWVDVVVWQDHDAAMRASEKFQAEMARCDVMTAIDPASVVMSHAAIRMSAG
jgi:hypothetical protein